MRLKKKVMFEYKPILKIDYDFIHSKRAGQRTNSYPDLILPLVKYSESIEQNKQGNVAIILMMAWLN